MSEKSYKDLVQEIRALKDKLYKINEKEQISSELNVQVQHKLVDNLANENKRLKIINKTFRKFVPQQFLDKIAKNGLENINIDKAEKAKIAILFSDIRSFTTISERLQPKDTLKLLNIHFSLFNKIVSKNNGFVDKYIGDEIMALFGESNEKLSITAFNAINAGIQMQEILNMENLNNPSLKLNIGIGVHIGEVIMGTVGSEDRMDSTVIGNTVNISSRLQELTKKYNCKILISGVTWRILNKKNHHFLAREVDKLHLRGTRKPITIFEIYNNERAEIIKYKKKMQSIYNQALNFYYMKNWNQSMKLFKECLKINPDDDIVKTHLDICMNEITKHNLKSVINKS